MDGKGNLVERKAQSTFLRMRNISDYIKIEQFFDKNGREAATRAEGQKQAGNPRFGKWTSRRDGREKCHATGPFGKRPTLNEIARADETRESAADFPGDIRRAGRPPEGPVSPRGIVSDETRGEKGGGGSGRSGKRRGPNRKKKRFAHLKRQSSDGPSGIEEETLINLFFNIVRQKLLAEVRGRIGGGSGRERILHYSGTGVKKVGKGFSDAGKRFAAGKRRDPGPNYREEPSAPERSKPSDFCAN